MDVPSLVHDKCPLPVCSCTNTRSKHTETREKKTFSPRVWNQIKRWPEKQRTSGELNVFFLFLEMNGTGLFVSFRSFCHSNFSYLVLSLTQTISAIDLMEIILPVISCVCLLQFLLMRKFVFIIIYLVSIYYSEWTKMGTKCLSPYFLLTVGSALAFPAW